MTTGYELVAIEDGEEELVATGDRQQMERRKFDLLADWDPIIGEQYGTPVPEYRVQPAK